MFQARGSMRGGLPGAHLEFFVNPTGKPPHGPYTVVAILMRPGQPPSAPDVVVDHEHLDGDSHVMFALPNETFEAERDLIVTRDDGRQFTIVVIANPRGAISKLRMEHIDAPSADEARIIATRVMHDMLSSMSLLHDVPLEVFRVDVIDETTSTQNITIRSPFSFGVWHTDLPIGDDFSQCAALYREALGTNSDFYSFLCFYKVIEAVNGLNERDAADAKTRGEQPRRMSRHLMPESEDDLRAWVSPAFPGWYEWGSFEIWNVAPKEARGKRLSHILDKYLTRLRHAIAHGLLDQQGLIDVDDPALQHQVRYWLPYIRFMARRKLFERFYAHILDGSPETMPSEGPTS